MFRIRAEQLQCHTDGVWFSPRLLGNPNIFKQPFCQKGWKKITRRGKKLNHTQVTSYGTRSQNEDTRKWGQSKIHRWNQNIKQPQNFMRNIYFGVCIHCTPDLLRLCRLCLKQSSMHNFNLFHDLEVDPSEFRNRQHTLNTAVSNITKISLKNLQNIFHFF